MVAGVEYKEGEFTNARGQKIFTVQYKPEGKVPSAAIIFCHGYGEHVGRYDEVFNLIASSGIAVHSFDAHGHGKSEPRDEASRCLVWNFDHLADDVYAFRDQVKLGYIQMPPIFIAGHSMGGLIASLTAIRQQDAWNGLIIHSALLDVEWTLALRIQSKIGVILAMTIPRARIVPAVRPEDMSPDPETVKKYMEDPLNFIGAVRIKTAYELQKGFRKMQQQQQELKLPIYACHGTSDKCTSAPAVKRCIEKAQSTDKTLREVEGGYHELLHSPGKEEHAHHIIDWVKNHLQK